MTLDAYSMCPGGTGKKIKHCACRDITGELDKIIKAIQGDQRIAALDRINRNLATKAHRPCLLALKITTLLGMKDMQGLEDTVTTFTKVAPDNPVAHGFAAILEARKRRMRAAVDELQTALSLMTDTLPVELHAAAGEVGDGLLRSGQYLAARAHTQLRSEMFPDDEDSVKLLLMLYHAAEVPLGLKLSLEFLPCPAQVTWRGRFDAAQRDLEGALWRKGLEKFEKLNQDFPDQPAVLWNIAMARSILALPNAAEAWRNFARCEGAEFTRAVTAATLEQLSSESDQHVTADVVKCTMPVGDANRVYEKMMASQYLPVVPESRYRLSQEDTPPPKGVFTVLDKPYVPSAAELTVENVPRALTHVLLFGKETDRPARLEFSYARSDGIADARRKLLEVVGEEVLSAEEQQEVVDQVDVAQAELLPTFKFPEDATYVTRRKLLDELMLRTFRERWPNLPHAFLDGKTPQEVAGQPAWRVRLAAALEVLDQIAEMRHWNAPVDELRELLGVPVPEPIDPQTADLEGLAATDWVRVIPERLSDEQLVEMWEQARVYHAVRAARQLGRELVRREHLAEQVDLAVVCSELAEWSNDTDTSLEYLHRARKHALAKGLSAAAYLLKELPLRILRNEGHEAARVFGEIQRNHLREPGVADTLQQILHQLGIIPEEPQRAPRPAMVPADELPVEAGALWTPDMPQPASEQPNPTRLWLPD